MEEIFANYTVSEERSDDEVGQEKAELLAPDLSAAAQNAAFLDFKKYVSRGSDGITYVPIVSMLYFCLFENTERRNVTNFLRSMENVEEIFKCEKFCFARAKHVKRKTYSERVFVPLSYAVQLCNHFIGKGIVASLSHWISADCRGGKKVRTARAYLLHVQSSEEDFEFESEIIKRKKNNLELKKFSEVVGQDIRSRRLPILGKKRTAAEALCTSRNATVRMEMMRAKLDAAESFAKILKKCEESKDGGDGKIAKQCTRLLSALTE